MAEDKLMIVIGEHRVLSELSHDAARGVYLVKSTCGDCTHTSVVNILPRPGYSAEQLEYDVEVWRHKMAEQVAGRSMVKTLLPGSIRRVGDQVPEVANGPRFPIPGKAVENA